MKPLLLTCVVSTMTLGVVLGGCAGGDDQRTGSEATIACLADEDCPTGQACDAWTGLCVCANSNICDEGERCNPYTGRCEQFEEGCRVDSDCSVALYCSSENQCRPRGGLCSPCDNSSQCGHSQDLCLPGGACGVDCSRDPDVCPTGSVCWQFGTAAQCVPAFGDCSLPPACRSDVDCPRGSTCFEGACVVSCQRNAECPAEWRCLDGYCQPPNRCPEGDDATCPEGTVCRSGLCVPGCSANKACPLGERCTAGRCVEGCDRHADCPLDQACVSGTCRDEICDAEGRCAKACQADLFCEPGQYCDNDAGRCRDGLPGGLCRACNHRVLGDCGDGNFCIGEASRTACRANADCGGNGFYCNPAYPCFFTRECAQGQECTGATPADNIPGRCTGGICASYRCGLACDPEQPSCPSGFLCAPVRVAGRVVGQNCMPEQGLTCVDP
ncbi:MAG: hypothetical protein VX405_03440 [Myxococcota bacterium]|nr:hypothetical protein [Myxococcota bacterium]